MRRRWVKLWVSEIVRTFINKVDDNDTRAVFFIALALAGDSPYPGLICVSPKMGYTLTQLAELFKMEEVVLGKGIQELYNLGYLTKLNKEVIKFSNWEHFQSEYERQKPYRQSKNNEVTKQGYSESYKVEVEVEEEVEEEHKKNKTTNSDKRIKPLINYFRDKFKERFNIGYSTMWGKDMKIIKNLLSTHSEDFIKLVIDSYLSYDTFSEDKGKYTIGVLNSQFNDHAIKVAKKTAPIKAKEKYKLIDGVAVKIGEEKQGGVR